MKILGWIKNNYLLLLTLFLLAFIPLYPKFPLFDIKHTWVYIRAEDFIIAFAWLVFLISYIRKKATISTPVSYPILVFWIVGLLATLSGIIFIFPKLEGVFPSLAILNYLRRVEYLSVFFLAYSAIKDRKMINPLVATLTLTLVAVFIYGLGQRLWGFPAFLTMNEEFAKGIPLRLSALARIPSTFAGHYDLAAYLILMIPIIGSLVFGYKKFYLKIIFFLTATSGLILLLMTASRVSFAVYLVSIGLMLVLQKQKKFIIPVFILSIILLKSFSGISARFAQTFTQVDLVVDSRTGKAIGVASDIGNGNITIEDKQSNGENLPTGSQYINLPQNTGAVQTSQITYKKLKPGSNQQEIISKAGTVIVKKAFAYDVSFTTRFQGEWPNAIKAFKRNLLLGSGYSSITLATDNSFLRMLGETGLLGFFSFIFIFIFVGIYLWRMVPEIEDKRIRSLIYGVMAGVIGLALNAILIDVFEASKVAFVLWLILGVTIGLAHLYQKKKIDYLTEIKKIFSSVPSYVVILFTIGLLVFSMILTNYFIGDDFTWLRWAADCQQLLQQTGLKQCGSVIPTITHFFTNSEGFFYRPGTKSYFFLAYPIFELFPLPFHIVSILLHISAGTLVFFIGKKLLKSNTFGFIAALLFLLLSVHAEAVYWASVTGHMVTTNLLLLSFLSYMYWRETKRIILFIIPVLATFFSMFFHEFGTTGPLLLLAYDLIYTGKSVLKQPLRKWYYLILLSPIVLYYFMRVSAQSVWFQGDYSYNLSKLPFNIVGNLFGYLMITVAGPVFLPIYDNLRVQSANSLVITGIVLLFIICGLVVLFLKKFRYISSDTRFFLLVAFAMIIIPLLPFLGLGNITARYAYTGSAGIVLIAAFLLQKLFAKIKNKTVGVVVVVILCSIYLLTQYTQLLKINRDWAKAGEITNNFLVSLNVTYSQPGTLPTQPTFYFINIPIRYGDAWVFPVGLPDALWFSFQNTPINVITTATEAEAKRAILLDKNSKAFKFDKDGNLFELAIPTPALPPVKIDSNMYGQ